MIINAVFHHGERASRLSSREQDLQCRLIEGFAEHRRRLSLYLTEGRHRSKCPIDLGKASQEQEPSHRCQAVVKFQPPKNKKKP